MYPFLLPEIFKYTIPMYDLMIVIGVVLMIFYVANRFEKQNGYTRKQTNRLLILLGASLLIALVSSFLVDGIFHSIKEGELSFGSLTFIGGLIGGIAGFLILLKYFYKEDNKDVKKIMNSIIPGIVLAHAIGRIGCFFAGCCFGIPTESFLGVIFPHGHAHDLYPDTSIYPTQLFESFFLFGLFIALNRVKRLKNVEVETYLIGYGVFRILIEFIRGDDRGSFLPFITTQYNLFPTPSQYLSLLMVCVGIYSLFHLYKKRNIDHS
jgi:phosphatidylglycerol---prolipoprotein diacylglyceryl transferase